MREMSVAPGRTWGAAILFAICGCAASPSPDARHASAASAHIVATGLLIDSNDGTSVRGSIADAQTSFALPAGKHELGISRHVFGPGVGEGRIRSEYATACIEATAGRSYAAEAVVNGDGSWTTVVRDVATGAPVPASCAPAPGPLVAQAAAADGAALVAPETVALPVATAVAGIDERPERPGTGLALRSGFALGGDRLVTVQLSNGQTQHLDAGSGVTFALAGTVTPFWARKRFGFGFGLEVGWKYDEIGASNGDASFRRFPIVATAHMLARVSKVWYVKLAAGVEQDIGCQFSISDSLGQGDVGLEGQPGPMGDLGLYYLFGRHGALDLALRYAHVRYAVDGASVDGSSVGALLALHYEI